jgi:hypothetical protein
MCEIGQTDIKEWCISVGIDTLIKNDATLILIAKPYVMHISHH